MNLVMDLGYTKFSQEGSFEKNLVVYNDETGKKDIVMSAYDVFEMLKNLPQNIRWDRETRSFVHV